MNKFNPWVTPLNQTIKEHLITGGVMEYEDIPCDIDTLSCLLHTLFQKNWHQTQVGHVVEGSVLELEFTKPPKICILYDGYLTVVTDSWHLHLCLEEHGGGPEEKTPLSLRQQRIIHRASFYRRFNEKNEPRSWGIQFWNGAGEKMMNIFFPNPFVDENENLLPEHKPDLTKLSLYEQLRDIYVLGKKPIPYPSNPLKAPYLAVCRSGRCYPSQNWQPIVDTLQQEVTKENLDVHVITSGCLEVCKMGPVVFYSGDKTWYTRVTPEVAKDIVQKHVVGGEKITNHLYPPSPH
ncbi:iron-sulfur cluster-binding protein, putative [Cyanobacterium stanieri PCC 7202]|uniref:Iron-sulfur cluster-binding protein, putative n=1 Tax=Cyanobacterium stanieri (strain ATCC 29140 / PCC 7202) TaxID=292563 RepID=K9YJG4_CYASC|nr:iron-sulfur cluster-binding protein, putative [Cyanobacterium stanieri PCC 7202]